MSYFTYILFSPSLNVYYKGITHCIKKRLIEHNKGLSRYTRRTNDWQLVFVKIFDEKSEALIYEKLLKRQNRRYIEWLIDSEKNQIEAIDL